MARDQEQTDDRTDGQAPAAAQTTATKPWETPAIVSREPLEAVAAACDPFPAAFGKIDLCGTLGS